jgi:hypothetical protein
MKPARRRAEQVYRHRSTKGGRLNRDNDKRAFGEAGVGAVGALSLEDWRERAPRMSTVAGTRVVLDPVEGERKRACSSSRLAHCTCSSLGNQKSCQARAA